MGTNYQQERSEGVRVSDAWHYRIKNSNFRK